MILKITILSGLILCLINTPILGQTFIENSNAVGLDHAGRKDGGVAWADFNNDGCLDMLFNTNTNNNNNRTRILFSDCNLPNPQFSDRTVTHADGLRQELTERSVSVGDFNNDGYIDFCRNANPRIEVYLNKGPAATPAFSFGDNNQEPNFVIENMVNGQNTEGLGWMDYDNDGWLDLIIENHNFGIDIYRNPADGSANFTHVTPNGHGIGLPNGGRTGDYMTLTDYNDDGNVDILARKENEQDLWTNTGTGTFVANNSFNQNAQNNNKGGVLFCDFDNDGDFDIFWSDEGVNQIFRQTGFNSGNFVATNEPAASSLATITNDIDGCSCGDVDNDGDVDLFLGGAGNNGSYLFLNNDNQFNFTLNNLGILTNNNTEGNSFGDYDNDGDLDLYINIDNAPNELWRNNTNNDNYLKVDVKLDLGNGVLRDDLGANVILKDCSGNILGGIRQVSSVKGHGSNDPAVVHFGLPNGNTATYLVEVHYTNQSGVRTLIDTTIIPANYTNQRITIINTQNSGLNGCPRIDLPVELVSFDAQPVSNQVEIEWITATEINNSHFIVERSVDGINWQNISEVNGAGNSTQTIYYSAIDELPYRGIISYYRLKQVDFDQTYSYSNTVSVFVDGDVDRLVKVYPNPTYGIFQIEGTIDELSTLTIYNTLGQEVTSQAKISNSISEKRTIDLSRLPNGTYFIKTKNITRSIQKQ